MLDHEGKEVPGNRGYKYFGAAKDLPGVKELFEQVCHISSSLNRIACISSAFAYCIIYCSPYNFSDLAPYQMVMSTDLI